MTDTKKMSLTQVLQNKDMSADDKLDSVNATITTLRAAYGNSDKDIKDVKINTAHGMLPFSHLEPDSKVEALLSEALSIKSRAIAAIEDNPGLVLNKRVAEMLATSAIFANASAQSEFDVL